MFLAGCPRSPVLRLGRVLQVIAQRVPQLDDPLGQSAEAAFGVARGSVVRMNDEPHQVVAGWSDVGWSVRLWHESGHAAITDHLPSSFAND